jgi:prepilin-type N-terminal cleavage/methylation domain-containing protein
MSTLYRRSTHSGFTLIECMFVLIIASIASMSAMTYYNSYLNNINNQVAAGQAKTISEASGRYIKDNYASVIAIAGPTTPATITVPMLVATGYLGAGFSSTNPYGQTYQVLAREPVVNQLETMVVTTGGMVIPELSIRRISQLIGANGGYISSANPAIVQGSFGGWQVTLANYSIAPGAGHYSASLFFQNGQVVNDYLYRTTVPGHPELNTMNASIDMGGNIINNANAVNASNMTGTNINGTNISGSTITGTNINGTTVSATTVQAPNINGNNAVISGRVTTSDLVISSSSVEGGSCSPNGRMSANSSGAQLSCMSGYWVKQVAFSPGAVTTGQICGNYARGSIAFDASGRMYVCK